MRGRSRLSVLAAAFTLAFAALSAPAQTNAQEPGPRFDKTTITTVVGVVRGVSDQAGDMGWNGVQLVVEDETGPFSAHLAPAEFLKELGFSFKVGDHVEVTGSVVRHRGTRVLLVTQIKKERDTLRVRLDDGTTVWW